MKRIGNVPHLCARIGIGDNKRGSARAHAVPVAEEELAAGGQHQRAAAEELEPVEPALAVEAALNIIEGYGRSSARRHEVVGLLHLLHEKVVEGGAYGRHVELPALLPTAVAWGTRRPLPPMVRK